LSEEDFQKLFEKFGTITSSKLGPKPK